MLTQLEAEARRWIQANWQANLGAITHVEVNPGLAAGCPVMNKWLTGFNNVPAAVQQSGFFAWHGTSEQVVVVAVVLIIINIIINIIHIIVIIMIIKIVISIIVLMTITILLAMTPHSRNPDTPCHLHALNLVFQSIPLICDSGFDPRVRRGQAMGPGEYFGGVASVSHGYSQGKGCSRMIVARVLNVRAGLASLFICNTLLVALHTLLLCNNSPRFPASPPQAAVQHGPPAPSTSSSTIPSIFKQHFACRSWWSATASRTRRFRFCRFPYRGDAVMYG